MNASDIAILQEMLSYCSVIETRIDEFAIGEELFTSNPAYADMLLMPLFQIGELASSLSDEYKASKTEIPWHAIYGFRNIIAHNYAVVDSLWAWNTIQIDIPVLSAFLREESE